MILIGHFAVERMHRSGKLVEMSRPTAPHAPRRNQKVYYSRDGIFLGRPGQAQAGPGGLKKKKIKGQRLGLCSGWGLGRCFASLDLHTHAKGESQSTFRSVFPDLGRES